MILTCAIASSGLVANRRPRGIPAFFRRAGSAAQHPGMHRSNQAQHCPAAVTSAENTQVTQFSVFPVTPECCGETQAVPVPRFRSGLEPG